jgi:hypothetical protein
LKVSLTSLTRPKLLKLEYKIAIKLQFSIKVP